MSVTTLGADADDHLVENDALGVTDAHEALGEISSSGGERAQDGPMSDVQPVLTRRLCGGWLAVTPDDYPLHFGATGDDEPSAIAAFEDAAARWTEAHERAMAESVG